MQRSILAAAIAIGLLAITIAVVLGVTGARLYAVQTPSMGETAPVGSLVVTLPESHYGVGDIITFRVRDETVTHRIVGDPGGSFTTKGDLNDASDGWQLAPAAIVGRVVLIAPGWGFALTAAPWLLLGAVVTEGVGWLRRARPGWRGSTRLLGWSVSATIVSICMRPWFNVRLLDYRAASDGDGVLMHVVNTGLLPVLTGTTRLLSGQAASILSTDRLSDGSYALTPMADPDWPIRLLLIVLCLLPFLAALLVRPPDPARSPSGLRARPDRRAGRVLVPVAAFTVLAVVVLVTVSTTAAAFAATVRNSTDTAGTNPFFTCRDAELSVGRSSTWAAFAMSGTGSRTERDFSRNDHTGTYASTRSTSGDVGCARDTPRASVTFDGSQCLYLTTRQDHPNVFSLEVWIATTTAPSGKIIGFGDGFKTPNDPRYWDRHIYLDESGRVVFGLFPNSFVRLTSPAGTSYADGKWHSVVANLSGAGAQLYVDGNLVDANSTVTVAQDYSGYWRIGCGRLTYWSTGADAFTGRIQYAAIYRRPLTALEVKQHDAAGR